MEYPWYEEVDDESLDQGDILTDCPAGYLPLDWDPEAVEQRFVVETCDLVVVTQACDLAQQKVDYVVCCAVLPHSFIDAQFPAEGRKYIENQKDKIIQGAVPGYAMIAAHDGQPRRPISVVSFRHLFSLPKTFLCERARSPHLRLLPPYREHISQGFARFFMRVGLPIGIPRFKA